MGSILQLHFVTALTDQCAYQNETCTIRLVEQLRSDINRTLYTPLTMQFTSDRSADVNVKLCTLTEMTGERDVSNSQLFYRKTPLTFS